MTSSESFLFFCIQVKKKKEKRKKEHEQEEPTYESNFRVSLLQQLNKEQCQKRQRDLERKLRGDQLRIFKNTEQDLRPERFLSSAVRD